MNLQRCEFCQRPYDPEKVSNSGRHPCCGVRSAGEMTGRIEGTCRIIGELGRGATGAVYLAQQLRLQRKAALKLLTGNALDENAASLFLSEIRAAGKLIHPNIARIYAAGETDKQMPYAIMEYVEGSTLEDTLDRQKNFTEPEVRRIALEIARALHYAWRTADLAHGDLKPANIMLRREDQSVCILDMGLQAALQENNVQRAIGTPLYAAPELVNCVFGINDFHADIYSLGIMLYEMLCGHAPFEGTPEEIIRRHQEQDAPSIRHIMPEVSVPLDKLICRMTARYAQERPGWAEVIKKLEQISNPVAVPLWPPPSTSNQQREASPKPRVSPRRLLLFLLALLLSAAAGFSLAIQLPVLRETPPDPPAMVISAADQLPLAFRLVEQGNTRELQKLMEQYNFSADTENAQGNTLLMQAVFFGRKDTVQFLLQQSPDLHHRNKLGETVFDLAMTFPEIDFLIRKAASNSQSKEAQHAPTETTAKP